MRDLLQRIFYRVRKSVHRVNAPFIACVMVMRTFYAVNRRVAQVDIRRCHVDFSAQNQTAIRMFAVAHFTKQCAVFRNGTVTPRRILTRFGQCAARNAHFFRGLAIDIGMTVFNQALSCAVHEIEIITSEVKVIICTILPAKPQPLHRVADAIYVFLTLFFRIGVIKTQMTNAAIIACQAKVQENTLGMTDVQITIRLGRKTGTDFC